MARATDPRHGLCALVVAPSFPPLDYKAVSQVAYDQARALVEKGVAVTVLTQGASPASTVDRVDGIEVHYVGRPEYRVSSWELGPLVWSWAYGDYMRDRGWPELFDLVHVHDLDFSLLMRFLAGRGSVPFLAHFHVCFRKRADASEVYFNLELAHLHQYSMAQSADLVVAVSESERAHLETHLHCAGKVVVVPNGIRVEAYEDCGRRREAARAKLGLEGAFAVLWGGRVGDWMKAPDIVGRAFSAVAREHPEARLMVAVVRSWPPENLEYLLGSLTADARAKVLFLYPADKEELLSAFAAADVYVMPSRYEPFGLMTLEAMACGLPVVVAPNGGLDEIVRDGEDGLKIVWGNAEESARSLASHIATLLGNTDLRGLLARRAKAAARRFDAAQSAARLLDVYRELIGRRRS